MTPYKFAVFDFDGTLVDSVDAIAKGIQKANQTIGIKPVSYETAKSVIGLGFKDIIPIVASDLDPARYEEYKNIYVGYFLQSVCDDVDGLGSVVAVVAADVQAIDAKASCAHHGDVHANLVVAGGVGSYMQAEVDGIVQVGESFEFNLKSVSILIIIGSYGLKILAIITPNSGS